MEANLSPKVTSNRKSQTDGESIQNPYKAILDLQADGVLVVDKHSKILYMNPTAGRILSLSTDFKSGERFPWQFEPDSIREIEIEQPSGKITWVSVQAIEGKWLEKSAYILSIKDITERKQEEEIMQQAVNVAEARTAELEAIKFVANQLNHAAMLEDSIQSGLETILALIDAEAVWVLLPEKVGDIRLVVIYNQANILRSEKRTLEAAFPCQGLEKLLRGELTIPTMFKDPECITRSGLSSSVPSEYISVPLMAKDYPMGVLNLSLKSGKTLNDNELDLMAAIGGQLAAAIGRVKPYSEMQEALLLEEDLNRVTRTIGGALDLPSVLQNVVRLAVELVDADAASLGLLTPGGNHLTFVSYYPENGSEGALLKEENLVWKVLETRESTQVSGNLLQALPAGFATGANDLILSPIKSGEQCLGILCLYHNHSDRLFNNFDRALVQSLGNQAGVAVQNAQLFFEVQQLTMTDAVTGLNNQGSFNNLAMKEVERAWRYRRPLSLIAVDLDDFKNFNEINGRDAGDLALKSVAKSCSESLRRVDILCRFEDDTFLLLLPETDSWRAYEVAERLRARIEKIQVETEHDLKSLTASIGVAGLIQNEVIDLDTLIDRTAQALSIAKDSGRNRVCRY